MFSSSSTSSSSASSMALPLLSGSDFIVDISASDSAREEKKVGPEAEFNRIRAELKAIEKFYVVWRASNLTWSNTLCYIIGMLIVGGVGAGVAMGHFGTIPSVTLGENLNRTLSDSSEDGKAEIQLQKDVKAYDVPAIELVAFLGSTFAKLTGFAGTAAVLMAALLLTISVTRARTRSVTMAQVSQFKDIQRGEVGGFFASKLQEVEMEMQAKGDGKVPAAAVDATLRSLLPSHTDTVQMIDSNTADIIAEGLRAARIGLNEKALHVILVADKPQRLFLTDVERLQSEESYFNYLKGKLKTRPATPAECKPVSFAAFKKATSSFFSELRLLHFDAIVVPILNALSRRLCDTKDEELNQQFQREIIYSLGDPSKNELPPFIEPDQFLKVDPVMRGVIVGEQALAAVNLPNDDLKIDATVVLMADARNILWVSNKLDEILNGSVSTQALGELFAQTIPAISKADMIKIFTAVFARIPKEAFKEIAAQTLVSLAMASKQFNNLGEEGHENGVALYEALRRKCAYVMRMQYPGPDEFMIQIKGRAKELLAQKCGSGSGSLFFKSAEIETLKGLINDHFKADLQMPPPVPATSSSQSVNAAEWDTLFASSSSSSTSSSSTSSFSSSSSSFS